MENVQYYDGTKLLSMLDINGNKPEIYMTTTNRSAGKTTYFNRLAVKRFKNTGKKFAVLYRFNYELVECADKFFKEIGRLFFPKDEMTDKRRANGIFVELFLNGESCGYCLALNYADQLKKFSHLLADVDMIIFDEFQSETNHYCPSEITKFISIHTSIARGGGKQVRYVPVYMISNAVSVINPYYMSMGIAERLQKDTRYLKGDGYVLEQGFYETVADMQVNTAFNRAFAGEQYVAYASQNVYLNDSQALIEKMTGYNDYVVTIKRGDKLYSVKRYHNGLFYVDTNFDETYPDRIVYNASDQNGDFIMVSGNSAYTSIFKTAFEQGKFRFKNQECKCIFFDIMKYEIMK